MKFSGDPSASVHVSVSARPSMYVRLYMPTEYVLLYLVSPRPIQDLPGGDTGRGVAERNPISLRGGVTPYWQSSTLNLNENIVRPDRSYYVPNCSVYRSHPLPDESNHCAISVMPSSS